MKTVIRLFAAIYLLIMPSYSFAKTYAYFIGSQGKIAKLDTEANAVTQLTLSTPPGITLDKILGADTINNYLYITHCVRMGPCKIGIYGLRTLNFVKELPIVTEYPDVQMLVYPDGSKFIVQYITAGEEGEEGGYTTDLYDAKTLAEIKNLQTIFGMEKAMFSDDSKKMYSIIAGADSRVDIIDTATFQVLASRNLTQIWKKKPDVFSSGIENFGRGKIVVFENTKSGKDLPNKLDFFIYDIETQTISSRISTGLEGNALISPDREKIIFDENKTVREMIEGKSRITGHKSLGRIHIYDVATGKELRMISFKVQGQGNIAGIRPAGDRLYYESEGLAKDSANITVIDIKNYQVLTTISLPFKPLTMIFFEQ